MAKLFFIKSVNTYINPKQVSSLYHAAGSAHVAMANGSDYVLAEDEYVNLINSYEEEKGHEGRPDKPFHDPEMMEKLKAFLDKNAQLPS